MLFRSTPEKPHPIQKAFIDEQAAQCGFCLSGVVLTAKAYLDQNPKATDAQIQQAMDTVAAEQKRLRENFEEKERALAERAESLEREMEVRWREKERELAERAAAPFGLCYRKPPVQLADLSTYLFWHRRYQSDPGNQWLRQLIVETFTEL